MSMSQVRGFEHVQEGEASGPCPTGATGDRTRRNAEMSLGWHYSSNATCLMRPHLFYAFFVVSRITMTCYIIRHF